MPPREAWESFFNPSNALETMELNATVTDVAEFGCGYGTFTIPAARMARGTVYAIDIDREMVAMTAAAAARQGLKNIQARRRDFLAQGSGLKHDSVDYVMLFNILHIEQPEVMLREAWRILKPTGKLGIIHWKHDPATPRGPSMAIRPTPEQCIAWAQAAGFHRARQYDLQPYHYGIVVDKEDGR